MTIKKEEIIKSLEDSINRLEETLTNASLMSDSDDIGFKEDNIDSSVDAAENMEGPEAAFMAVEGRIEEMTQILSEEIDSLRTLMEKVEEEM